ncbi:hypothetical protein [Slackia heliotrinireducens]|uniref:hypothetical protein n=1 Tax=Slackia heliotrinireducens TaxID=84110 RepID=UPI003315C188
MPSNSIAFARNYTAVIDEVYQRASVSGVLNSGRRMVRAGNNAKEILIPKISVTGLGDYTRSVGYKTGAIHLRVRDEDTPLASSNWRVQSTTAFPLHLSAS